LRNAISPDILVGYLELEDEPYDETASRARHPLDRFVLGATVSAQDKQANL